MLNRILLSAGLLSASIAVAQYNAPLPGSGSKSNAQQPTMTGCPWLTEGTAATAIGGDVSTTVNMAGSLEGECKFSKEQGSPDFLEIRVSKAALPACPAGSMELKGIGNEATRCTVHGRGVEMISSRVRDLNFTVTLASHRQKGAKPDDPQNDALEQVAEEVAGSLY